MKRAAFFSVIVLLAAIGGTAAAATPYQTEPMLPNRGIPSSAALVPPPATTATSYQPTLPFAPVRPLPRSPKLYDGDPTVRQAAVLALANWVEAKAAIPALAQRLADPDRYIAADASITLKNMGAEAVPSVAQMLHDPSAYARVLALRTLRLIGPDAKAAVAAIVERLSDCDADAARRPSTRLRILARRPRRPFWPWPSGCETPTPTSRATLRTPWAASGRTPCPVSRPIFRMRTPRSNT